MFEGFTRSEIKTSGARIVTVHGGKGPPLLLMHGNPSLSQKLLTKNDGPRIKPGVTGICSRRRTHDRRAGPEPRAPLVSRFRSSQTLAALCHANFGIKGTLATL